MALTINEFFEEYQIGKGVDYDGQFQFQCFDLANEYIYKRTDKRPIMSLPSAKDIWYQPDGIFPSLVNYEQIANQPDNYPNKGDIIIWDAWGSNSYGHVALVIDADGSYIRVLQQDGFTPTVGITEMTWDYNNVLGWFRINSIPFHDLTINNQNNDMAILQDIKNKIQNEPTPAVSTETKNAILNSFDSGDYGYGVRELNWSKNDVFSINNQKKDVENKLEYTEQKLTSQEAKYNQELAELKTNVSQIKLQADKPLFNFKQESATDRQLKTEEIQKAVLNFVKNNIATITTVLAGLGFSQSSDSIIQIVSLILGAMGYVVSYLLSLNSVKK